MSDLKRITRDELAYNIVALVTGLSVAEAAAAVKRIKKAGATLPEQKEKTYTTVKRN